jgi:hypothetical protein
MNKTHHLAGEQAITDADWDEHDALNRLKQMSAARDLLDFKIEETVREARTTDRWQGSHIDHVPGRMIEQRVNDDFGVATWQQIADALGVSRQSAHRKYAHLID